jgi:hypothetical protein
MTLKCRCDSGTIDCQRPAKHIMITGCEQNHIEETPLCQQHLDFYVGCYHHEQYRLLLCDTCKTPVLEYDHCPILNVTKQWMDSYIAQRMADEIMKQYITATPTISPSAPHWLGTSRVKNTNPIDTDL